MYARLLISSSGIDLYKYSLISILEYNNLIIHAVIKIFHYSNSVVPKISFWPIPYQFGKESNCSHMIITIYIQNPYSTSVSIWHWQKNYDLITKTKACGFALLNESPLTLKKHRNLPHPLLLKCEEIFFLPFF